jgi:trans-aconitate methyltransferase
MSQQLASDLQQFYDQQASKFHHTRKRHWPEFDHILAALPSDKQLDVVELGCGDGRLYTYLEEQGISFSSYL